MIDRLDEEIYQRVDAVIRRARRSGVDPIDRLNEASLLWTPKRQAKLQLEAIKDLNMEFDVWRPAEFLRLVSREMIGSTPADMHQAVRRWLQDYAEHARKQLH